MDEVRAKQFFATFHTQTKIPRKICIFCSQLQLRIEHTVPSNKLWMQQIRRTIRRKHKSIMPTASRKQKCTAFVIVACLTKISIMVLVFLFFAWITTPKARLARHDVTVKNLKFGPASPSFSLELDAVVDIKNPNFGRFEILNGTVTVSCSGMLVGRVSMGKDKVKALSSKKTKMTVSVNYKAGTDSQADSWLNHELEKGVIPLNFLAKFKGRVRSILMFLKEGKTAEVNCVMGIDIETKAVMHQNCHVRQISVLG